MLTRHISIIALALAASLTAQQPRANLVLVNGRVLTVDAGDRIAQAVAIAGNRIVAVGTNDEVTRAAAAFRPGVPTDPATTMGAIVSQTQHERVLSYIEAGKREGARIVHGGGRPSAPELARGWFVEPTIFADVTPDMTIACEEIFGPVLSILKWSDEAAMLEAVNATEFGLTCAIWTNDLNRAHRTAMRVEAGYVWINHVGQHLLGAPFGGFKQSGMGREECLEELISFTQEKNININLARAATR